MCGIAGIICKNSTTNHDMISKMTDSIIHRGPDGEGIWINSNKTIGFGHRRLAIIDLTETGKQPMHYKSRYVITYNGEIYNYLELKNILLDKGYVFNSKSDTEVIMAAYDFWGVDCLSQFDGMFAFSLYDSLKNEIIFARDRFGEKPFYYSFDKDRLVFASEMKAIWAAGVDKSIDDYFVYLFLNYGLHENPYSQEDTFFKRIKKLKSGHYIVYKLDEIIEQIPYWKIDLSLENRSQKFDESCNNFKRLFNQSVSRRLRSDVSIGSSLSGGLDSSSVVLTIDSLIQNKTNPQKTFSARFTDKELDEGYFMEKVISGKNIFPYYTYPDHQNLIQELPQIMYHQEEPFGSASIYAQWEVFKLAKEENVVVLLDGQGADEYLAGYTHFFYPYLREIYRKQGKRILQKTIKEISDNNIMQDEINTDYFFRIETLFPELAKKTKTLKRKVFGAKGNKEWQGTSLEYYSRTPPPFEKHLNLNDSLFYLTFRSGLEKLLRFADRNSMAFSREIRLPFLSHELVEYVFSLPSDFKIRNGWTKAILRHSLNDILPDEVAWRKNKLGFQPPQKNWELSKEWNDWKNDYHHITLSNRYISDQVEPNWRTINMGVYLEMVKT